MKPGWLVNVDWQEEVISGEGSFRCGRLGSDHVAVWNAVFVIRTDESGSIRELWCEDAIPTSSIEKLKRGAGSAFVRSVRGEFSCHAAAVAWEGGAVLLLGDSGAGKSTASYTLCRDHAAALLADDIAAINTTGHRVTIEPTELVVWLSDSSGSANVKMPRTAGTAKAPSPLMACAFLSFDDSPAIRSRRLGGTDLFQRLAHAMLRFAPSPQRWVSELDVVARIAAQAHCFEVVRSRHTPAGDTAECVLRVAQPDRWGSVQLQETPRLGAT